ncbi:MAG: DUF4872 domain-containing protein [Phycisphaerales bacterium]
MTTQHDFKSAVRDRMKKTGERYTAARAVLLQSSAGRATKPTIAGLIPEYTSFGGICRDTGAMRNVLAACGIIDANTKKPLSEAMVAGLCGGVGFLYAVFEYKGFPPILSIMGRHDTMPDVFIAGGFGRLGVKTSVSETTSAATARKALDAAITAKKPALCVVDAVVLADKGTLPASAMEGMAPTIVGVAGATGDDVLIDDGGVEPRRMSMERFARARAAYKKGKNRLITIDEPAQAIDLRGPIARALADTAHRYRNAPYKGFASNMGLAGFEKWRGLLTDPKDKKSWPNVFPEGALAYLALRRTYDGIEHEFTAPAAGRPIFADFLDEASATLSDSHHGVSLKSLAKAYRKSGEQWGAITTAIATCGDKAVEQGCELGDSAREIFDEADCPRRGELVGIAEQRTTLAKQCTLKKDEALAIYERIARHVAEIESIEREASEKLAMAFPHAEGSASPARVSGKITAAKTLKAKSSKAATRKAKA